MKLIYHITTRDEWERASKEQVYYSSTLETEGYIHCSLSDQLIDVANAKFKGQAELVLLAIDEGAVESEIRYESPTGSFERYPHIYGPLEIDTVIETFAFEPAEDVHFELPWK